MINIKKRKAHRTGKFLQLTELIMLFFLGNLLVVVLKPGLLFSVLIPYLPPVLVSLYRIKHSRKKIFVFSVVSTLLLALPFELLANFYNFWQTRDFSIELFKLVPVENLLFFFLHMLLILFVYERFFDKDSAGKYSPRFKILISLYILFFLLTTVVINIEQVIPVTYLIFGLVVVLLPMLLELSFRPNLLKKVAINTLIWLVPVLSNELAVIFSDRVIYTGQYIFMIPLGTVNLPIEELLFWVILSTPSIILGYEVFLDDGK